jgi:hypothetical protein
VKRSGVAQKRFWPALAAVVTVLLALATVVVVMLVRNPPSKTITLLDGRQFRFVGVTYGTNSAMIGTVTRLVRHLPPNLQNFAKAHFAAWLDDAFPYRSADPTLCFWFRPVDTNYPPSAAAALPRSDPILLDDHGRQAMDPGNEFVIQPTGTQVFAAFQAVPRRSRTLELRLFPNPRAAAGDTEVGRITVANPVYGKYPQWTPEPVPSLKTVDDLAVQLDVLTTDRRAAGGVGWVMPGTTGAPYAPSPPRNNDIPATEFQFFFPNGSNTNWALHHVELSDATGNDISDVPVHSSFDGSIYSETFAATLWPDEAAWRLSLHFKRTAMFDPADLVTFKNVPLPESGNPSTLRMAATSGNAPIVLDNIVTPASPNPSAGAAPLTEVTFQVPLFPYDTDVGFVGAVTDTGAPVPVARNAFGYRSEVLYLGPISSGARTLDFTWVVQKFHTVTFLVAPPRPAGNK